MSSTSVTDSVFDMDWSYQGGSGDLREVKRESRRQAKDKQTMEDVRNLLCVDLSWKPHLFLEMDENR